MKRTSSTAIEQQPRRPRKMLSEAATREKLGGWSKNRLIVARRSSSEPPFPLPYRFGPAANSPLAWDEADIDAYLDAIDAMRAEFDARARQATSAAGKASWAAGTKRTQAQAEEAAA